MTDWLLSNEGLVRLAAFLGFFALLAAIEFRRPLRPHDNRWSLRWSANLGLAFIGALLMRVLFPAAAVGFGLFAEKHGLGLMRVWSPAPVVAIVTGMVLLDLAIYFQHVVFHFVPTLWRFHRVHHADMAFDITTAMRFHPLELLLSMAIKALVICLIGPPILAIMLFELLLNASSLFTHANIRLPAQLDRFLRIGIVTPDMHRIHHSTLPVETNSNFGFNISVWDRVFGTYRSVALRDQSSMQIGINGLRDPASVLTLRGMLVLPFQRLLKTQDTGAQDTK